MSSKNNNKLNIPEARAAMDKFKMDSAADFDASSTYSDASFSRIHPRITHRSFHFMHNQCLRQNDAGGIGLCVISTTVLQTSFSRDTLLL